jgi:predicted dehydrogenase
MLRVGIIGGGRIGTKRARLAARAGDRIAAVADPDPDCAAALAAAHGARAFPDAEALLAGSPVDAVVVATPHRALAPAARAALEAGADALVEKPLAMTAAEAAALVGAAERSGRILATGFTLRQHPGLVRMRELVAAGAVGEPLCIRCCYGHGGRAGYEREWRARRAEGGGELLDQGVHAVDLVRWLVGEIAEVQARLASAFWKAEVEDNAFLLLDAGRGAVASVHVSWTEWRNRFRLELFGAEGALLVSGLGGSYGPERLTLIERPPAGGSAERGFGPPVERTFEFGEPGEGPWAAEWAAFRRAVETREPPEADGRAGLAALRVIEAARRADRERRAVAMAAQESAAVAGAAGRERQGCALKVT